MLLCFSTNFQLIINIICQAGATLPWSLDLSIFCHGERRPAMAERPTVTQSKKRHSPILLYHTEWNTNSSARRCICILKNSLSSGFIVMVCAAPHCLLCTSTCTSNHLYSKLNVVSEVHIQCCCEHKSLMCSWNFVTSTWLSRLFALKYHGKHWLSQQWSHY